MPRSAPPVQKISQRLHVTQDLAARAPAHCWPINKRIICAMCCALKRARSFCFSMAAMVNGWGSINDIGKKQVSIELVEQTRTQDAGSDIWLLVAPVKKDRLDYLAQKATEMGVGRLLPVMTARTQGGKTVKHDNGPPICAPMRLRRPSNAESSPCRKYLKW